MMKIVLSTILVLVSGGAAFAHQLSCLSPGTWADGRTGVPVPVQEVFQKMANADVVLLGESHGVPDIQLWQAATATTLSSLRPAQYGYEMFPRSSQPALDSWSQGDLDLKEFLLSSDWESNWGYDARSYDPVLRLPRIQAAPSKALNIDRSLVRRVSKEGWDQIEKEDRQGIGNPAPALPEYRKWLKKIFRMKASLGAPTGGDHEKNLQYFEEAQLLWDRSFAEGIAQQLIDYPDRLPIAFVGRGHVEYGYGIEHQLANLGIEKIVSAISLISDQDCNLAHDEADRPIADYIYFLPNGPAVAETAHTHRPRIGVVIEDAQDGGALVKRVLDNSPAAAGGFLPGDVVIKAAGLEVKAASDLGRIIRSHTWGAWLPFSVKRGGMTSEVVVKLPISSARSQ